MTRGKTRGPISPAAFRSVITLIASAALASQTPPPGGKEAEARRREALVASAKAMIGKTRITALGKSFASDCSGTVMAICWGAGLDLGKATSAAKGANGVSRIHDALSRASLLLGKEERPRPGDLVFWDDTYDKNGNGKADDPLTHIGIVISAGKKGQYSYVHYRYDKGVIEEFMNLEAPAVKDSPSGERLNSNVRISSWKPDARRLAGELYRGSGSAAGLEDGWKPGS